MSEPKFTPGPHKVEILGKEKTSVIICSPEGQPIASLYHEKNKLAVQKANAFLYAAAPERQEEQEEYDRQAEECAARMLQDGYDPSEVF